MRADAGAVVVGGGLAGAAVALSLARAGRPVTLLEKSQGPHHKICGEFLSYEALHYLQSFGIDVQRLGAVPIRKVRFVTRHGQAEAPLPFAALSLSRCALDEHLLQLADACGVRVLREHAVEGITKSPDGWRAHVRGRDPFDTPAVFLASGKHDIRTLLRPAGKHVGLVGFKMHFRLRGEEQAALGEAVELVLFPGGYAGLQAVEHGAANLCLLVAGKTLRRVGDGWPGLQAHLLRTAPHLARRLQGAEPLFAAPLTVASIPYGFVQRQSEDGLWRVGDQAAVIPSFSGDGMAIALHSGVLAAQQYLRGNTADTFQRALAGGLRRRVTLATWLSQALVSLPGLAEVACYLPSLLPRIALMTRIRGEALLPFQPVSSA